VIDWFQHASRLSHIRLVGPQDVLCHITIHAVCLQHREITASRILTEFTQACIGNFQEVLISMREFVSNHILISKNQQCLSAGIATYETWKCFFPPKRMQLYRDLLIPSSRYSKSGHWNPAQKARFCEVHCDSNSSW